MRVLMVIRPDADENLGGDRVQMIETAKSLRDRDIVVIERVGNSIDSDYDGVDVVHLFNFQTPEFTLGEARRARAAGKRVVVSTIWWDYPIDRVFETSAKWRAVRALLGKSRSLALLAPRVERDLEPERKQLREIVALSDLLLPNSWIEAKELQKLCLVDKICVVPNGINAAVFDSHIAYPRPDWVPAAEYLICAARLEPQKRQHALATVAKDMGIPCVLAGAASDPIYARRCVDAGALLVGLRSMEDLAAAYQHARVYAQPSLRETPGLSALEAAAMGCPVVVTKNGSTKEYFGSRAYFVDPYSDASIAGGLRGALASGRSSELSAFVRESYTWKRAGNATLRAYSSVVAPKS